MNRTKVKCSQCDRMRSLDCINKYGGMCNVCAKAESKKNITRSERISIKQKDRERLWYRDYMSPTGLCNLCGKTVISIKDFVIGHIQSLAEGGENSFANYKAICSTCNSRMGSENAITYEDRIYGQRCKIDRIESLIESCSYYLETLKQALQREENEVREKSRLRCYKHIGMFALGATSSIVSFFVVSRIFFSGY